MTIKRAPPLLIAALWLLTAWGFWQSLQHLHARPQLPHLALVGGEAQQRLVSRCWCCDNGLGRVEVLERLSRGELPQPVEEEK